MAVCNIAGCPLKGKRVVPYKGQTNAKILGVGESPGYQEEKHGTPFYLHAKSGAKIRELTALAGLDFDSIFIANSTRCMIEKDKLPRKDITKALACCRTLLERAIAGVKPKAMILFGDYALQQVLKKKGIKKARGKWVWSDEFECWVMPTYHPAYILRNASFAKLVVGDLKAVKDFIDNNYQPVENTEDLIYREVQSIAKINDAAKNLVMRTGVDSETQGLDWTDPNFLCISASISLNKGKALNFSFFKEGTKRDHDFTITWPRLEPGSTSKKKVPTTVYVKKAENFKRKLVEFKQFLENPKIKKYMFNGNHEVHSFRRLFRFAKMKPPRIKGYVMDVQAAVHLVDENIYQLATLELVQRNFTDYEGDYKGKFNSRYDKEDMLAVARDHPEDFLHYACADADVTLRAGNTLRKWFSRFPRIASYLVKFTMPTLNSLMMMEEYGARIDLDRLPEVEAAIEKELAKGEKACLALLPKEVKDKFRDTGKGLKLTRDALIREALFGEDGFGLEVLKKTKTGPSCDKNVRKLLLDKPLKKKPREFIIHFNEWNEFHTLLTRYIRGFEKWVRGDGCIHSKLSLAIAVTGRVSSRDPNVMNNPKRSKSSKMILRLIIARDGYVLLSADASQSELRWLAHVALEKVMQKIFRNASLDIHTETAKLLVAASGLEWKDLSEDDIKKYRFRAKAVNFGLIYGMGLYGFIRYCKLEYDLDLSEGEGEAWREGYFTKYKGVPRYHREIIDSCIRNGYVDSPLGRRRRLPEIHSDDKVLRGEAERQAMNHPIQEPSSSTCLMTVNEFLAGEYPEDECRPILFIHDELTFEVREDLVDKYAKIIKNLMENPPLKRDFGFELSVPLKAEFKVGKNLGDQQGLIVN